MANVLQNWVTELSFMQQSVLLSGIRGPDGIRKYHPAKSIIKWYRRCVLISAFDKKVLTNPCELGGGSFTGPSVDLPYEIANDHDYNWEYMISKVLDDFLISRDELPYHYTIHMMHAFQIVGVKHPDDRIRKWWAMVYQRMVSSFHLFPESEELMDKRLGDVEKDWEARSDEAGSCSQ